MPRSEQQEKVFEQELQSVCDDVVSWRPESPGRYLGKIRKAAWVLKSVPIPVFSDWSARAERAVAEEISKEPDLVIFDFPHAAILAPAHISCPSAVFTHNIEAEIFKRHWEVARSPLHKWLWSNQYKKMLDFESRVLNRFDTTIAVSERDCEFFEKEYGVPSCRSIPTGVDTDFFSYEDPTADRQVVFCGSMDWLANIDGMQYFFDEVWPLVRRSDPDAKMKVVGRSPPPAMVRKFCAAAPEWEFTGFVDDVRDHIPGAAAFVIPLRVGGGTRIKAFEAMAMGSPVVSTSIGIEGLPVEDGEHYLRADSPEEMARQIIYLLNDSAARVRIATQARKLVEDRFGFRGVARRFEDICVETIESADGR